MSEFEPKQFGKYYLLDKLAVGGMAEIYKAKTFGAEGFEKLLVIKRILPHCSADKEFITMLIDEAKLSVLLSHANVVQVYDLGKLGDDYFIAMEFIHGVNLRDIMLRCRDAQQPVPPDVAVYIVSEICKGLDYAHRKTDNRNQPLGIVHRDVSPQNVLISYEGEVKIVDFGIAKAAMNISHTMAGILKGKIAYMSPEQALGHAVDSRTDIFSVGILLYEMLTGTKLFTGESQFEVLKKIRTMHVDAGNLPESVPQQLRPVLAKALAYRPEDRFQSAGDFQVELTKFLYAIYLDFSPRKLASFIAQMFGEEIRAEGERAARTATREQQTSSMSVNEAAQQVEIVHGSTPTPARGRTGTTVPKRSPEHTTSKNITRQRGRGLAIGVTLLLLLGAGLYGAYRFLPGVRFWETPTTTEKEKPTTTQTKLPTTPPAPTPAAPEAVGVLNLITEPTGAAIMVDGRLTGLSTPATLEKLPLNTDLRVTLSKPDYEDFEQTVRLGSAEPQKVSKRLVPLVPERGGFALTSTPAGAQVFINEKDTGRTTPATIGNIEVNQKQTVKLVLKGYEPWTREVALTEPKTIPVDGVLAMIPPPVTPPIVKETAKAVAKPVVEKPAPRPPTPAPTPAPVEPTAPPVASGGPPGKIKIASNPSDADVFVNAEYRGRTPLSISVPSGQASVLVSKEGKARYATRVTVRPGETVNLSNVKLGELYGEVSITTTPPRAAVVFDGQQIPARTPVTVRKVRTDQQHSLSVTLEGYQPWVRNFTMDGETKSFNIVLER